MKRVDALEETSLNSGRCCCGAGCCCDAGGLLHAWKATVGPGDLGNKSAADETLQLLIGTQTKHFFSTTDGVFQFQVLIYETKKSIKLVSLPKGQYID